MSGAEQLDSELLEAFMEGFFGYGSLDARVWLIGMEEGAGRGIEEVQSRLKVWDQRSRPVLEDVRDYHIAFGLGEAFATTTRPERTWGRLIKMLLAASGQSGTPQEILDIQRTRWAREGGTVCLAELLPLPSQTVGHWRYATWTSHPDLSSRKTYEKKWKVRRRAAVSRLIAENRPDAVIFYSKSNRPHWQNIAGSELVRSDPVIDYSIARSNGTTWIMIRNPGDWLPESYFENVGHALRHEVGPAPFRGLF